MPRLVKYVIGFKHMQQLILFGFYICLLSPTTLMAGVFKPDREHRFILKKSLTIPKGHATLLIQNKTVTTDQNKIDQYEPNCSFEQRNLAKFDKIIKPETFTVRRSMLDDEWLDRESINYKTIIYLRGIRSQMVYTMECSHWGHTSDNYLTRNEIKATLKHYFDIEP